MANVEVLAGKEQRVAYVILRVSMGVSFCGHGFVRMLHGNDVFARWMIGHMAAANLPTSFVYGFGWILPVFEALLGLALVFGIAIRWTLLAGALLMMALMGGTALLQDWQGMALQLFYSFLLSVLLFLRERYDAHWLELLQRG